MKSDESNPASENAASPQRDEFVAPHEVQIEVPIEFPRLTQRLSMRRFKDSDAPAVGEMFNDREIASQTRTFNYPYSQEDAAQWISKHQQGWEIGEGFVFAIERQNDGVLMGAIGLHVNKEDHQAELGYTIGRDFWGQGFCTEAAKSVIEFGFEELGLHKITSHHLVRNPASGRVLQKIGMTHEGTCRDHVRKWGVFEDVEVYGMLASDERSTV